MNENSDQVRISVTGNEALVLFELLSRFAQTEELRIEDQAEERVLWDLLCLLEKQLAQPLSEDYGVLLERARSDVRD